MGNIDGLFPFRQLLKAAFLFLQVQLLIWFCWAAYEIRTHPIKDFGLLIHEFDPWFNYRATEYLAEHGLDKFFKWYDYESWYPLGRPIGTTIYPGMQITAVWIWEAMKNIGPVHFDVSPVFVALGKAARAWGSLFGLVMLPPVPTEISFVPMSINDICCLIPCWFGVTAAITCGLMAHEVSRSTFGAVITVGIMAIIPAGLMRSVAGEFDNEAVAMTAICLTFWLWMRCVRNPTSWPYAILAGISYIYMVAAWGGYIFVLNMIGVHALMLVGLGRFNSGVHKAYTLFFIIGTAGAVQIPVVGWQPLRSLEQMGPLLVFVGYQALAFCDFQRRRRNMNAKEFVTFRIRALVAMVVALVAVCVLVAPTGYFGPLSSRIRGLFVKHTRTGNPLVDSVAEHQPANPSMYSSYLSLPFDYAYFGVVASAGNRNNAFYFMCLYGFIAEHFSGKMARLVIICAPIVSMACGIWCGWLLDTIAEPFFLLLGKQGYGANAIGDVAEKPTNVKQSNGNGKDAGQKGKEKSKEKIKGSDSGSKQKPTKKGDGGAKLELAEWEEEERPGGMMQAKRQLKAAVYEQLAKDDTDQWTEMRTFMANDSTAIAGRAGFSFLFILYLFFVSGVPGSVWRFVRHCDQTAQGLSNPQVVYKAQQRDGTTILVDDYLKGYQWIDANTPKDSRVMAWWDYGYQITGIAKRTSIADGNTWNHEHIATLGRTMTSPERKAWNTIRHLADYILVWAGGGGDDLAKSPHLARIGNSVFPDHCGDADPKCNKFGFYDDDMDKPTPMMARSLLYKLCVSGVKPGVKVDEQFFKEVHATKYGLMRIFKVVNISQESKDWVADPQNRICDAPGSWYCVGQYPPAIQGLIAKRRDFAQVEDFNKNGTKSAYTKMIERDSGGMTDL